MARVYIDGFNLYRRCLQGNPELKWLNVLALAERLLPDHTIDQVHYFTANIKPGASVDLNAPVRQQTYLRALRTLEPRVVIHHGKFRLDRRLMPALPIRVVVSTRKFETVYVRKTEEKGSDVNLATRMLADAFLGKADLFVALTNDSDQVGPLTMMKNELGFRIGIIFPLSSEKSVKELARIPPDVKAHIMRVDLEASQFPDNMTDKIGLFFRPPAWT